MTNESPGSVAEWSIRVCLVVVGLIHLLPVTGALGDSRLAALYGIALDGPDLIILMRHRAVLFGIVGVLLLAAARARGLRRAALASGLVSVASFLVLALSTGGYNTELGRVVAADVVALALLVVAGALELRANRAGLGTPAD